MGKVGVRLVGALFRFVDATQRTHRGSGKGGRGVSRVASLGFIPGHGLGHPMRAIQLSVSPLLRLTSQPPYDIAAPSSHGAGGEGGGADLGAEDDLGDGRRQGSWG